MPFAIRDGKTRATPHGFHAADENGLAFSEPRRRCAWPHHGPVRQATAEYKAAARLSSRALREAPLGTSNPPTSSLASGAAALKTASRRLRRRPSAGLDRGRSRRLDKNYGRDEETLAGRTKKRPQSNPMLLSVDTSHTRGCAELADERFVRRLPFESCAAPHPALRAAFSPRSGEKGFSGHFRFPIRGAMF